jgi:hypothetical protein
MWPPCQTDSPNSSKDAETGLQLRSHIVQTLHVPQGYASALHSLRPCWTACLSILLGKELKNAARDIRDERDEVGIQSVHVAPFSHVSHFTRHGLWRWRTFSASCYRFIN